MSTITPIAGAGSAFTGGALNIRAGGAADVLKQVRIAGSGNPLPKIDPPGVGGSIDLTA